jgi:hypothetical protein
VVYGVSAGEDGEGEMNELYIDTEHLRDFASVWDGDKLVADFYATGAVANAKLFIAAPIMREFIESIAKGPYKDSNLTSWIEYAQVRAGAIIKEIDNG